jgi:hypothetical protein
MFESREALEVEALRIDRYLDALLAAADRHAIDVPAAAEIDPALRAVVRRLRRDLVRVHPSFRFEERLAQRLADLAARTRLDGAVGPPQPASQAAFDLAFDPAADPGSPVDDLVRHRPLLVGGAMASAALSLAGAAIVVARRRGRPETPMTRAARAAHRGGRGARRFARARRAPLA